jgi:N-acetylneuraminic acid mutarotase
MPRGIKDFLVLLWFVWGNGAISISLAQEVWSQKPSIPDREGFASPIAGVSHDALLVAGGANFPDAKPWEGGKKVYYDRIYILKEAKDRSDSGQAKQSEPVSSNSNPWKEVGRLPRPMAYGVSVTWRDRVLCAGGNDQDRVFDEVFSMEWLAGKVVVTPLPSLPVPLTNACGGMLGDAWIVCGGIEYRADQAATTHAWRLDLANPTPRWEKIDPIPGPSRMLAMSAVADGSFWVIGGVELLSLETSEGKDRSLKRHYLNDVYRWSLDRGWSRAADLPTTLAAGPTPCPSDSAGIYVVGGDDGSQVAKSPLEHQGFSKELLRLDLKRGSWERMGVIPAPRVTVPCIRWLEGWVIPSGEKRPGIRSPEVWQLVFP